MAIDILIALWNVWQVGSAPEALESLVGLFLSETQWKEKLGTRCGFQSEHGMALDNRAREKC